MNPVLYIMMRSDMASLNSGKACAQAAHAANAFVHEFGRCEWQPGDVLKEAFDLWSTQTSQGFGTTIVLSGTKNEIDLILNIRIANYDGVGNWVIDPTYPILDGDVKHLINIETCAWYFVADKTKLTQDFNAITKMPLMP